MAPEPTVFVVDDDAAMRDSLRWLLESDGLAVETFASAEEFLASCDPGWRGCLVLDLRMPGMGGLELQGELRTRRCALPVIVVTAYGDAVIEARAFAAGARRFFNKPFDDRALLDAVRDAIGETGDGEQGGKCADRG